MLTVEFAPTFIVKVGSYKPSELLNFVGSFVSDSLVHGQAFRNVILVGIFR